MKTILITGATSGIGLALAEHYARAGWRVIGHARHPRTGDWVHADLAAADCASAIASQLQAHAVHGLDVLIHNAGIGWFGDVAQQPMDDIYAQFTINLASPLALTHALLPLINAAHGRIAFVSSVASALPVADYAVYAATKAALDGFARALAAELPGRVLVLWPGGTRTGMHARAGVPAQRLARQRLAEPQAVAAAIARATAAGRSRSIGAGGTVARWAGTHAPALMERAMQKRLPRESVTNTENTADSAAEPSLRASHAFVAESRVARQHVMITGFADGIGLALAKRYAAAGYRILGVDVDAARGQAAQIALGECAFHNADLSTLDGIASSAAWLQDQPAPDVVIQNAGINAVGRFEHIPIERHLRVLRVNLLAPMLLTRALLSQKPAPHFVFISSLSHYLGYPGAAAYAASKDGVAAFSRCLRAGGVRTLAVFPGPTRTAHAARYSPDNTREARRMLPQTLAGHIFDAQQRGAHALVPGLGNRVFAMFGRWLPGLANRAMKRMILDQIEQPLI